MSMSKKHYVAIANVLKNVRRSIDPRDVKGDEVYSMVVDDLCIYFKQDNPNFDGSRFRWESGYYMGLTDE